MKAQFVVMAILSGAGVAVQVGVNALLRRYSGQPVWATLVSFVVGSGALAIAFVATRAGWPPAARFAGAPWWVWTGGLIGAAYVLTTVVAGPRLGAAAFLACVIAGQLVASVVIDHFGWLGFATHAVTSGRLLGALLLIAGVALILRF